MIVETIAPAGINPASDAMRSAPIRLAHIRPSPTNPRKSFDPGKHAEMVDSVRKHGVLQPVLLRLWPADQPWEGDMPLYELVAGERRYRAATDAGQTHIPGLVKDLTDEEVLELQIIENLHRDDLNALEEADGFATLMQRCHMSADALAEKIGKSRGYIYARLKLTELAKEGREAYGEGRLEKGIALLVARLPPTLQARCLKTILDQDMTHRQASELIRGRYMLDLKTAPFPGATLELVEGHCTPCPRRTGNQPELYRDVRSADVCTDPECYERKKQFHLQQQIAEAKAAGRTVLAEKKQKELASSPHFSLHGTGLAALDKHVYDYALGEKNWGKPAQEILKGTPVPVVLVPDHTTGKLIEAVEEGALRKALLEATKDTRKEDPAEDKKKAQEAAAKAEAEFRRTLLAQIRDELTQAWDRPGKIPAGLLPDMRLIARQFWSRTWHDSQKKLARAWTEMERPEGQFENDHHRVAHITGLIDGMSNETLMRFMIELALTTMTDVPGYVGDMSTPSQLIDTARRYGIDPDACKADLATKKACKEKKAPPENLPLPIEAAQAQDSQAAAQTPADPVKAARAGGAIAGGKSTKQAADAARNKGKTSGRASPSGGTKKRAQANAPACPLPQPGATASLPGMDEQGASDQAKPQEAA